jgi:hypothetical protein
LRGEGVSKIRDAALATRSEIVVAEDNRYAHRSVRIQGVPMDADLKILVTILSFHRV